MFVDDATGQAYPDTLVGTDSHTTMVNGLGVLGWGVGGIEAEAAMLGQPMSMLIPQVVGFKLTGELPEGATATDLVLTVTEMLREHGVVGKFVEFYGAGAGRTCRSPTARRSATCRPEFGSTCAIFPIDAETLRYLEFSGRPQEQIDARRGLRQGAGPVARRATPRSRRTPTRSSSTSATVVPSIAGPEAPAGPRLADRVQGGASATALEGYLPDAERRRRGRGGRRESSRPATRPRTTCPATATTADEPRRRHRRRAGRRAHAARASPVTLDDGTETELDHGHVVIAAITSCTNTSNPSVMLGAGLLARNAVAEGPDSASRG